jgi:hypothetical protein
VVGSGDVVEGLVPVLSLRYTMTVEPAGACDCASSTCNTFFS